MTDVIRMSHIGPVGIYGRDQHGVHWTTFEHIQASEHGWVVRPDMRCDICGSAIGSGYESLTGGAKWHVCATHVVWEPQAEVTHD